MITEELSWWKSFLLCQMPASHQEFVVDNCINTFLNEVLCQNTTEPRRALLSAMLENSCSILYHAVMPIELLWT